MLYSSILDKDYFKNSVAVHIQWSYPLAGSVLRFQPGKILICKAVDLPDKIIICTLVLKIEWACQLTEKSVWEVRDRIGNRAIKTFGENAMPKCSLCL